MAKWIANALSKHGSRGALHRHLGVPEGEKIPDEKLAAAKHSKNPKVRREAALAQTLKGMHHKKSEHHPGKNMVPKMYGSKG